MSTFHAVAPRGENLIFFLSIACHSREKVLKPRNSRPKPGTKKTFEAPPSKRRLLFLRVAALLLPFVAVGMIELGLRLGGYGFDPHFFKRLKIGGEDYLIQNDAFSYRFFPPENARNPGVLRMKAVKPPGTFRIFIFGESAAMGDPEPSYGPARYTEAQLRAKFPEAKFEVVNVAFTAINSHVILPIARECARHDGDLWIIYMGNNEMVGPYGAATVFGRRAPPLAYARFITAIQTTRIGQLAVALARKLHGGEKFSSWGGMQMFLQNQVPPHSPLKENVYHNFEKNLDDIVHAGLGSGAKVLLNTVAVNLRDCPAFASLANTNLAPADLMRFGQYFTNALQADAARDAAGAEKYYAQAAQLDETFAELQYRWGQCLLRQTNFSAAREHLQLACDDDASPFRTDSRLNDIIRAEAKKNPDHGLVVFDAADTLCGDETFYEHVHFDFAGSYRTGLAWAQQVEKMFPPDIRRHDGWLTQEESDSALGLSDWNRVAVWEHMAGRLSAPPFAGQPGNNNRATALQARVRALRSRMDTNSAALARENFQRQLARTPDDFFLRENFMLFLQSIGDATSAVAEGRRVHDLIPHDYVPYFQLGRLLAGQRQWSEAESDLRAALKIHPALTEGWQELGNVLAAQQRYSEALHSYGIAREQRPQDGQTIFRMGKVYALMHQPEAALRSYREAAKLEPLNWEIHFQLGGALDEANRMDEALAEFGAAARLNPDSSRTHFNYGVLLAKSGRLEEARQEFSESLRLEPSYKNAQEALVKVQMLSQRRTGNQFASPPNP
jgi:tetratricopeptide (TPR) repeat protein